MHQRVTLKQVAALAGVSHQTVSKVLNRQAQVSKETEDRICHAVRTLGYSPSHVARSLRLQRSRMIGYSWAPSPPDQANPILDQLLQSMLQAAERADYYLLSFPHYLDSSDQVAAYRELMKTGRVDGFVVSSVEYNDRRVAFLQEDGFPFVAFGRSNPEWDFPYVDVDGAAGLRMATEHLLGQGHRRIAALAWPESSRVGANRLEGYLSAMQHAGISVPAEWIVRAEGRFTAGREATSRWLGWPPERRPTAIVALNDAMAIGAMRAVQDHGLRVGPDVAITGFDDAPMSQYLAPPLTTLRQPTWEVGQRVVSMLASILDKTSPADTHVLLLPELIVRGSSSGAGG